MKTTPEQRLPSVRLQTHGTKLIEVGEDVVAVARIAYDKHYQSITTMRQAFEDIPLAGCDKRIVRALRGFAGRRRMAGWWIYRTRRLS